MMRRGLGRFSFLVPARFGRPRRRKENPMIHGK